MKKFENENRTRKYGKRKGDIVHRYNAGDDQKCEVISIDFMDNNRFLLKGCIDGFEFEDTPEHYNIITKVEDL